MIYDLHNDLLTFDVDSVLSEKLSDAEKKRLNTKYSKKIVYAVWTTRLSRPVQFLKQVASMNLRYTAIEDMSFISPVNLAILDVLKPAYASLTWNGENALAGGARTEVGLTTRGRWVIELLQAKGIVLDTAHLSKKAFFQAVNKTAQKKSPIICSHTCFSGIFRHPRNLTDRQIRAIIARDGVIGLSLVPEFVGKAKASVEDVVCQIDYFTQKFGCNNLAIGTDFFGVDIPALKNYRSFGAVKLRLMKLGYSANSVDMIFFKNAQSFLKKHKATN